MGHVGPSRPKVDWCRRFLPKVLMVLMKEFSLVLGRSMHARTLRDHFPLLVSSRKETGWKRSPQPLGFRLLSFSLAVGSLVFGMEVV